MLSIAVDLLVHLRIHSTVWGNRRGIEGIIHCEGVLYEDMSEATRRMRRSAVGKLSDRKNRPLTVDLPHIGKPIEEGSLPFDVKHC